MESNTRKLKNASTSTALIPASQTTAVPVPAPAGNPAAPFASYIAALPLNRIVPNPQNPRREMADEGLQELAESIRRLNVESPILVMPLANGTFRIVYGERRFRASQLAGKTTIPAKVEHMTDEQAEIRALHENIQRENMTPFDEGRAFENLHKNRNMSIPEICATFAKGRAYVENRMNLTKLIPEIASLLRQKEITLEIAQVLAKYDAQVQKSTYDEHFKSDGWYSWRGISAKELDRRLFNAHLTKLDVYHFDKTECRTCASNTGNNVLFEECGDCAACRNPKCLQQKNTAYLIEHAIALAAGDPYLNLVFMKGEASKEVIERIVKKGHEVKLLDVHIGSLTPSRAPLAPDLSRVEDEDDRRIRQQRYEKELENYKTECAKLDLAVIKGRKTKYGVIRDKSVEIYYGDVREKSVPAATAADTEPDTEKNKVLGKDKRNFEIRYVHTVRDLKKEIAKTVKTFKKKDSLTPMEQQAFHFILLKRISSASNMALLGMKDAEYDDAKCLKYAEKITERQKNMLYRMVIADYLSTISENRCVPDRPSVKVMLDFMALHSPERYSEIDRKYKETYEKHHQTLLKRAADLDKEKELLRLKELEQTLQKQGLTVDMQTGEILTLPAAQTPDLLPAAISAADAVEEAVVVAEAPRTTVDIPLDPAEIDPDLIDREVPETLPDPAETDPEFIEWEAEEPFAPRLAKLPEKAYDMPQAA